MNKELAEAAGKALTDFLIENYVSADPLSHIVESQSNVIKNQREEIEALKNSNKIITVGDFRMEVYQEDGVQGTDSLCIFKGKDWKLIKTGDLWKSITKLYFRTEEKRSCENCAKSITDYAYKDMIKCGDEPTQNRCLTHNYSLWQPKRT